MAEYGLMAAIVVWAAAVGLMAYRLEDSPWRWAFAALALGGIVLVKAILWMRKYIDNMSKPPQGESHE
ncbi:MAG: hypothetical protein KGL03_03910 [Nitrospirota bacterium]|nr:hypothetical protein [Nitrospirota bacterium]